MFGSDILEVAIGLSLIYLLMSALCSAVREMVEAFFKTRAVELERGIREMLHTDPTQAKVVVAQVYEHPLIRSLYRGTYAEASKGSSGRSGLPSYIHPLRQLCRGAAAEGAARGEDRPGGG